MTDKATLIHSLCSPVLNTTTTTTTIISRLHDQNFAHSTEESKSKDLVLLEQQPSNTYLFTIIL